jgi:carbonic anhydrase/acetyltransferase-like protein (isoleucine patch superfamily)
MPCFEIDGVRPVVHPTAYVHPTAILIGDVRVGPGCYVGPAASLRGDFGSITLEEEANLQDTCVVHGFPRSHTIVRRRGHVGHGAVLHGCIVGEDVLVGMNSVIMDGVDIGAGSIVSAVSFVKSGFECPPRSLVVGVPAVIKRQVSDKELQWKQQGTGEYVQLTKRCLANMAECAPLTELEQDRPALYASSYQPKGKAS